MNNNIYILKFISADFNSGLQRLSSACLPTASAFCPAFQKGQERHLKQGYYCAELPIVEED